MAAFPIFNKGVLNLFMLKTESYDVLFVDQAENENDLRALPTPNGTDEAETLVESTGSTRLARLRQKYVIKFGVQYTPY
ncbi:hypothetical protein O1611_g4975 [Lasiodiplodia mahajangana]|uniref:Uncharacterized protein n=1 Tax=Lasiodiplodia mahajangana TaxID=1108764 RepID=A0ACC2JMC4_9PEZI|nr:hypothetical protein O1611_g4975 [Lasiodiplodia mahajangana]